jgi:predicted nucleic acid-binding protein
MIFVDSNIPMYVVGKDHPNKPEALRLLKASIDAGELSARDALHAAIMERHGVHRVLSFDGGFDEISNLVRNPRPTV